MHRLLLSTALMTFAMSASAQTPANGALIARAKSFELDTPYVPPPGDPMAHHAAGYAQGDVLGRGFCITPRRKPPGFARRVEASNQNL